MPDAPEILLTSLSPPRLTYAQAASSSEHDTDVDAGVASSAQTVQPEDVAVTVAADTNAADGPLVTADDDVDEPSSVPGDSTTTFELDEEEDELFLFQESLRRGAAAQIRRRLLTRDSLIRQAANAPEASADSADEPPSLLTEQLNWVSARSLALQDRLTESSDRMRATPDSQQPEMIPYDEVIDDGDETFIDPRTLNGPAAPPVAPYYNRVRRATRSRRAPSPGQRDSIFFHSPPQVQPSVSSTETIDFSATSMASSALAAQLNAPPPQMQDDEVMLHDNSSSAATRATRRSNLEVLQRSRLHDLHRASTTAAAAAACGKPVLLLYCSAGSKSESTSPGGGSLLSPPFRPLPEGWYRPAEERDDASTSTIVVKPDSGIFDSRFIGGGGCGRLLCARGSTTADIHTVETDTAPIPQNVGWLESIDDPVTTASSAQRWQGCRCSRAYIGCRHCGNGVGYGIITQCKRCSNTGRGKHKWVFAASSVETRPRVITKNPPFHIHDYTAELAQEACESNTVMRWMPSALPTREQDRQHGLAGDEAEWMSAVSQILRRLTPTDERTYAQAASQRSMSFGMPRRTPEADRLQAETTPLLPSSRLERMVDEVADDLDLPPLPPNHPAPMAPRALLLSRASGLSPPASPSNAAETVESARTADIINRTRALRRNLRDFLSLPADAIAPTSSDAAVGSSSTAITGPHARNQQTLSPSRTLSTGRRRRRRSLSPSMRETGSDIEGDIFRRSQEALTPAQEYAESVRRDHRRRRLLELLRSEASDGSAPVQEPASYSAADARLSFEMVGR